MLHNGSNNGTYRITDNITVKPEQITFGSYVLDFLFEGSETRMQRECDKSAALDRLQINGGDVG